MFQSAFLNLKAPPQSDDLSNEQQGRGSYCIQNKVSSSHLLLQQTDILFFLFLFVKKPSE